MVKSLCHIVINKKKTKKKNMIIHVHRCIRHFQAEQLKLTTLPIPLNTTRENRTRDMYMILHELDQVDSYFIMFRHFISINLVAINSGSTEEDQIIKKIIENAHVNQNNSLTLTQI